MTDVLKHRFVSPHTDGSDLTQVQPSAWNDGHRFIGGNDGDVLCRSLADPTFGAVWRGDVAAGAWVTIPHDPAMYTASAGTWTVTAANQLVFRYLVIAGRIAFFVLYLDNTTMSASAVRVYVTLPASVPLSTSVVNAPFTYYTGVGDKGTGFVEIGGSAVVGFLRDIAGSPWPATSGTFLRGEWFVPLT